jgi:hypothetical protein
MNGDYDEVRERARRQYSDYEDTVLSVVQDDLVKRFGYPVGLFAWRREGTHYISATAGKLTLYCNCPLVPGAITQRAFMWSASMGGEKPKYIQNISSIAILIEDYERRQEERAYVGRGVIAKLVRRINELVSRGF